jgi:hypothetical protein
MVVQEGGNGFICSEAQIRRKSIVYVERDVFWLPLKYFVPLCLRRKFVVAHANGERQG